MSTLKLFISKTKISMKKIIALIIFSLISITCGNYKPVIAPVEANEITETLSTIELYYFLKNENITSNLNEWGRISYDTEGNEISQWFYISEKNEKFYNLRKNTDSTFVIKINSLIKE